MLRCVLFSKNDIVWPYMKDIVHIFHISTTKSPFSYCKELYKLVIKVRILSLQQHHKR